ncbi:MAG: hypothetical protein ACRDTD_10415 [Pseudonocardiaceae bacterium]
MTDRLVSFALMQQCNNARISTTLARQLAGKALAITFVTAATCGGAHVAEFVIRLACPTGRPRLLRAA